MNLYKKYTKDEQTLTLLSTLQQSKEIYMETAINEMKKDLRFNRFLFKRRFRY